MRRCSACRWLSCWPAAVSGAFGSAGIGAASPGVTTGGRRYRAALAHSAARGLSASIWRRSVSGSRSPAVVLAQSFVSLPFLVVSLEGPYARPATSGREHRRDARWPPDHRAAHRHAATGPAGLISGAVLAFARSSASSARPSTFAGSAGRHPHASAGDHLQRETDPDAAIALSAADRGGRGHVIASASRRFAATL